PRDAYPLPQFATPCRRPPRARPDPYSTLFRSLPSRAAGETRGTLRRPLDRRIASPGAMVLHGRLRGAQQRRYGAGIGPMAVVDRSEEHTSELQSQSNLVCRLLLEKKKYLYIIE